MPLISTFCSLSDRALGGFGGRPIGFNPNFLATPNNSGALFKDFVIDSLGNTIVLYNRTTLIKLSRYGIILAWITVDSSVNSSLPVGFTHPKYINIDSSDNIYLSVTNFVLSYDSTLTLRWEMFYSVYPAYQGSITNMYVSDSGVVTVTDDINIVNINATNGSLISCKTGSGSTYPYLRTYAYCLLQNSSSAAYVYLGPNSSFNGPYNTNAYFTLSMAYGTNSVAIKYISYPSTFIDSGYVWSVTREQGNGLYISDHAYLPTVTGSSYYVSGMYAYTATAAGQTRYYVSSFYSLVTLVGTTPTISAPTTSAAYFNISSGGVIVPGNFATFIDNQGNYFSCWGYRIIHIVRYNNAISGTGGILWSNILTCPAGHDIGTIKLQYNSVTDSLIIKGDREIITVPGTGAIPSTGTYVIAGITYTYQTTTLSTSFNNWTFNTINTTSTAVSVHTAGDSLANLPDATPVLNTLLIY